MGWALVGFGQAVLRVFWIDFSEVGPGVEPGGVPVVEDDFEGVVADHLGGFCGDGVGRAQTIGEDGEGVAVYLFAELTHFGGWGHFTEVGDGVVGFDAIIPADGEACVFFEIKMFGGDSGGAHGDSVWSKHERRQRYGCD